MQKLSLNQSLQQKLSPQQIQFIKLLQIPTAELEGRVEEELEINPALEEGIEDDLSNSQEDEFSENNTFEDQFETSHEVSIQDYLHQEEYNGYKMQGDGGYQEEEREMPLSNQSTLYDNLIQQFGYLKLNEKDTLLGVQLLGSIESDGYIRRSLQSVVNDLAFSRNLQVSQNDVEKVLKQIQNFEPAGVGARDLQECLLLQLARKNQGLAEIQAAIKIIKDFFDEFSKKHYEKIQKRLSINDDLMKEIIKVITRLNPKPGSIEGQDGAAHYLIPDFLVSNIDGILEVHLNSKNAPELKISRAFSDMLDTYDKSDKTNRNIKETITFVKQKLDAAKWFIDAIKQRQNTLLRTMNAIVSYQYDFFLDGDEAKLKPMILKDIANRIDMDVSTVSRVANSKSVQAKFGIYSLKHFFSEGISTEFGEDASSREVKSILKNLIEKERKNNPLSDDKLEKILNEKGYNIARRTVAKYREQLNIPVARLRKQL
jgi:RNA polymerase sigma-54 factor